MDISDNAGKQTETSEDNEKFVRGSKPEMSTEQNARLILSGQFSPYDKLKTEEIWGSNGLKGKGERKEEKGINIQKNNYRYIICMYVD